MDFLRVRDRARTRAVSLIERDVGFDETLTGGGIFAR
jgi:hypothetical protein